MKKQQNRGKTDFGQGVKMLKSIPKELSPELMHTLMSMGHGDEIVLADGNFPAASNARIGRVGVSG